MTCDKCKCKAEILDKEKLCNISATQNIFEEDEVFTDMMETINNATEFYKIEDYDY